MKTRGQEMKKAHDRWRASGQSWRALGYTAIPNLLTSKGLPPNVRLTGIAVYQRAFGKRDGVCVKVETLAKDVGFSRQTITKHLNYLQLAGIIKRFRRGQGLASVIRLELKKAMQTLTESIAGALPRVHEAVVKEVRHTMAWWLERWKVHKEAMHVPV